MWEWLPYCAVDDKYTVNGLCAYSSLLVLGLAPVFVGLVLADKLLCAIQKKR